jgi:hypothetical protein
MESSPSGSRTQDPLRRLRELRRPFHELILEDQLALIQKIREERMILGKMIREERITQKASRRLADKAREILADLDSEELKALLKKVKDENNTG